MVGRTPWSAADALVGLPRWPERLIPRAKGGGRAPRADRGARPTRSTTFHRIGHECLRHAGGAPHERTEKGFWRQRLVVSAGRAVSTGGATGRRRRARAEI